MRFHSIMQGGLHANAGTLLGLSESKRCRIRGKLVPNEPYSNIVNYHDLKVRFGHETGIKIFCP